MTREMTAEGLENLKKQLSDVRSKLKDVAQRIKEARELGDLSENAEYIEAKNEQSILFNREAELEEKVKLAKVVNKCGSGMVGVGCSVEVENGHGMLIFQIVGSDESDPLRGRISPDSPVGAALCGHKTGDKIMVKTPVGTSEYKIVRVT